MTDKRPSAGQGGPLPGPPPDLTAADIAAFRDIVLSHYRARGRDLPWRRTADPYKILVSEVMLQQTQVARVVGAWGRFTDAFPGFAPLAAAPLAGVLAAWRSLGYNRRALYLKEIARIVIDRYAAVLPGSTDELVKLPGIGINTAGAIAAFAFNTPAVFIETNIRSVFIHHFFAGAAGVRDNQITPLVEATLDRSNPRIWYWALMDYGAALKETTANPGRRSAHYARQSPFAGSNREIRGAILKLLVEAGDAGLTDPEVVSRLPMEADRVRSMVQALIAEGFVAESSGRYRIA